VALAVVEVLVGILGSGLVGDVVKVERTYLCLPLLLELIELTQLVILLFVDIIEVVDKLEVFEAWDVHDLIGADTVLVVQVLQVFDGQPLRLSRVWLVAIGVDLETIRVVKWIRRSHVLNSRALLSDRGHEVVARHAVAVFV